MTEVNSSGNAAGTTGNDPKGPRQVRPTPTTLEDARAQLARVDELPVSQRAQLLAAVNELMVAELAAMDEGGEGGLGAEASLRSKDRDKLARGGPQARRVGTDKTAGGTGSA